VLILDAAIVGVALPSIGRDLDFAREDLSWVANAYMLMFGGFQRRAGTRARPCIGCPDPPDRGEGRLAV
jgi:MFS family permease